MISVFFIGACLILTVGYGVVCELQGNHALALAMAVATGIHISNLLYAIIAERESNELEKN